MAKEKKPIDLWGKRIKWYKSEHYGLYPTTYRFCYMAKVNGKIISLKRHTEYIHSFFGDKEHFVYKLKIDDNDVDSGDHLEALFDHVEKMFHKNITSKFTW